jgi:hypothetical protein
MMMPLLAASRAPSFAFRHALLLCNALVSRVCVRFLCAQKSMQHTAHVSASMQHTDQIFARKRHASTFA